MYCPTISSDPASGDANDWYTHDVGIRWSYTIELRDQGFGFQLPPIYVRDILNYERIVKSHNRHYLLQIIPSGEEMWEAYKVCFNKVLEVSTGSGGQKKPGLRPFE